MANWLGFSLGARSLSGWVVCLMAAVWLFTVVFGITTLWQHQTELARLGRGHHSLTHSVPMTLGMLSSVSLATLIGAVFSAESSLAYGVGAVEGIVVGLAFGWPLGRDFPLWDGLASGLMGGLMGVMIGTMIPVAGFYFLSAVLVVVGLGVEVKIVQNLLRYAGDQETYARPPGLEKIQ